MLVWLHLSKGGKKVIEKAQSDIEKKKLKKKRSNKE